MSQYFSSSFHLQWPEMTILYTPISSQNLNISPSHCTVSGNAWLPVHWKNSGQQIRMCHRPTTSYRNLCIHTYTHVFFLLPWMYYLWAYLRPKLPFVHCTPLALVYSKYPSVSSLTNACPHHRFPFSLQSIRETVLRNFHVWGCRIYIKNISLDLKSPDRNCGYGIAGMIL